MENRLVQEYRDLAEAANVKWLDYVPEGAESREQVRIRVRHFLEETICKDVNLQVGEGSPQVLVVAHGGVIRELFATIFDDMKCALPPNCKAGEHHTLAKNTSWSRFVLEVSPEDNCERWPRG